MNVWIIGRNYPDPSNKMSGSFELEQAKMLAKKGATVCYLAASLHPTKRIKSAGFQSWEEDGVSVFTYSRFFLPRVYPLYCGAVRDKLWNDFLTRVEEKAGKPDVIHIHYPVMMLLANVMAKYRNRGAKIVATEHWTKVLNKKLDSYELKQQKKYIDIVDSYICVGSPLRESILEMTNSDRDISIIPNVVNDIFKPVTSDHTGFDFVAVGRLIKLKQFDKMIAAFAELFKGEKDIRLTIVGGGEEAENLRALVRRLDLDSQVIFTGPLNRQDTACHVSKADCLVCYSTYETFGVPIIEAWACGIPTITTTSAAAVIDYFDEKLGISVSSNDFDGLKNAMLHMHKYRKDYDKEYITSFAENHFSEKIIVNKLFKIYENTWETKN